jgi:hypothetical protein
VPKPAQERAATNFLCATGNIPRDPSSLGQFAQVHRPRVAFYRSPSRRIEALYLSIKAAAMAASLISPPSYEQIQEFFAPREQSVVAAPQSEVAAESDRELFAHEDFSYLPPWEAADLIDPPLPPAADGTEDASADEQVAISDPGLVAPLPAYWVAGTDEPEADTDAPETEESSADAIPDWPAYLDGTDDDLADDSYAAPYTTEFYRDMNSRSDSASEVEAEVATDTATGEEALAEPAVDETADESLDGDWYDTADTEDPFGPVADEYEPADSTAADSFEAAASEAAAEPIANQYEPYPELNVDSNSAAAEASRTADTAAELAIDPALVRVIADWHRLSPESRQAILTLVQQDALQTTSGN